MSWSEPKELFSGHDPDGQSVKVWELDVLLPDGTQYVVEHGMQSFRLARLDPRFLPALEASLRAAASKGEAAA